MTKNDVLTNAYQMLMDGGTSLASLTYAYESGLMEGMQQGFEGIMEMKKKAEVEHA